MTRQKQQWHTVSPLTVQMVSTRLGGEDSKKSSGDKKNQFTFFSFLANAKVRFIYSNLNNIFSKSHSVSYYSKK
jgi:hypothetical protein